MERENGGEELNISIEMWVIIVEHIVNHGHSMAEASRRVQP